MTPVPDKNEATNNFNPALHIQVVSLIRLSLTKLKHPDSLALDKWGQGDISSDERLPKILGSNSE